MGEGITMLLVGFLVGGVAASVVWAVVVSGRRRAANAQRVEREQIMASVGEALAEADAIETGFRSGQMPVSGFRRDLGEKVTAIMRLLRTNMHSLDSFFVKYAEQEAREYLRIIDNPERRRQDGSRSSASASGWDAALDVERPLLDAAQPQSPAIVPIGAFDKDAEREIPPFATPTADVADDTVDKYEPEPAEPDAGPGDTSIVAAVGVEVETFDRSEQEPPSPAPVYEEAEPEFGVVDEAEGGYEPEEPEEPDINAADGGFEAASEGMEFDDVSEEELVLGEPAPGSGPAPIPAPLPAMPTPQPPVQSGDDTWTGGKSIDEFEESAYAQFEIPTAPPQPMHIPMPQPMPMPMPQQSRPLGGDAFNHEFTETSSIDRSAIQNAMAAAGQPFPSIQTPLSTQMPPLMPMPSEQEVQVPLAQVAQYIEQEERREQLEQQEQQEHQGITGDDVADSIDNFFKLK